MSITSSLESTFLTNPFISAFRPKRKARTYPCTSRTLISNKYSHPDDNNKDSTSCKRDENHLGKLALVTLAAGVLTLGSIDPASATKTGGRVGGQAFKSPAPRSSPRINNSRTNVYINPPVAPPLIGGYGYGYGVPFYGGWGWSPFSYFAPGPGVAVGVGGGFDSFALFLFLGAGAAVVRNFLSSKRQDEDDID